MLPVAVIGGSEVDDDARLSAQEVGGNLARRGLPIICGGRTGVMEAACKGCAAAGGISIGVLPRRNVWEANEYCTIVLPTDLGNAKDPISDRLLSSLSIDVGKAHGLRISRNRVIVGSALCVFVVAGSDKGTGDEVDFARMYGLRAFGLNNPACPKGSPGIWGPGGNGKFSKHATVEEAFEAFDVAFPQFPELPERPQYLPPT